MPSRMPTIESGWVHWPRAATRPMPPMVHMAMPSSSSAPTAQRTFESSGTRLPVTLTKTTAAKSSAMKSTFRLIGEEMAAVFMGDSFPPDDTSAPGRLPRRPGSFAPGQVDRWGNSSWHRPPGQV